MVSQHHEPHCLICLNTRFASPFHGRLIGERERSVKGGVCPAGLPTTYHPQPTTYLSVKSSQTAKPITAGNKISAQSCHSSTQRLATRVSRLASLRSEVVRRDRRLDGSPRIARTISSLPLRSAIRIVAELIPLVD